jgi:arginyl-tRNA synthetase
MKTEKIIELIGTAIDKINIEKQNNQGKKKVTEERMKRTENQILKISEINRKANEIILQKLHETIEELEIKFN